VKLLLENWRGYLNERKSDIMYEKITDFVLYLIQQKHLWDGYKGRPATGRFRGYNKVFYYVLPEDKVNDKLFEKYRKMTGDNSIIPNFETFKRAFGWFQLIVAPPGSVQLDGSFRYSALARNGKGSAQLTINGNHYVHSRRSGFGSEAAIDRSNEALEAWDNSEPEEIYELVRKSSAFVKAIINHEATHFINQVQTSLTGGEVRGGSPGVFHGEKYIDAPDEIQARLIAAIKLFKETSEEYKSGSFIEMDPKEFLELFSFYYNEPGDPKRDPYADPPGEGYGGKEYLPDYWKEMGQKMKRKVIARTLDTENGIFVNLKRRWQEDNPGQ